MRGKDRFLDYEFRLSEVVAGLLADLVAVSILAAGIWFAGRFFIRAVSAI